MMIGRSKIITFVSDERGSRYPSASITLLARASCRNYTSISVTSDSKVEKHHIVGNDNRSPIA
jgi:hypothetical protein